MEEIKLHMPWPPTVNHYHQPARINGKTRIIKGAKAREYSKKALEELTCQKLVNINLEGDLSVSITLRPPTARNYDIDNRTKGIFDALSYAGFWVDDSQVKTMTITKGEKIKGGLVEMIVCTE